MKTTYRVDWPCGCGHYCRLKITAARLFHSAGVCPRCGENGRAEKLVRVQLAPDAFERAANNVGGYEDSEETLKVR